MTKKDFMFIADAIILTRKLCKEGGYDSHTGIGTLEGVLASRLSAEYPRFNKEKWFAYIDDGVQK